MVIVSGASGFIGGHLVKALGSAAQPISLRDSGWPRTLASNRPSAIVHLAGLAHGQGSEKTIQSFYMLMTNALCKEAIRQDVTRFLFLSSIGAVAENSKKPLTPFAQCDPMTSYGRSKLGAERAIQEICLGTKTSYTIIRPPLVYGPKNPGNMARLLKLADTNLPLPLAALDSNRRSFVGVSNLIDLILLCLEHPAAANQTFHVSDDDDDISTAELLRRMRRALCKPVRNLPIPQSFLKTGLRLAGKGDWVDKLCGDLRVDISETKRLLGWTPKVTMEEELERTAKWWRTRKK